MKLSIIIPCYNESESIIHLIKKCIQISENWVEIILVDNGSSDDTFKKLSNINLPDNIKVLRIDENIGYGYGIISGLKYAKGTILSWTHADLQTDIYDVVNAYHLFEEDLHDKKCLVKGIRKKRNFFDSFFSFFMGLYCSLILRSWMYDINAQPKLFHKDFLSDFVNPPMDFSLDLFIIHFFKTKKIAVNSFPVYFSKRKFGEAKGGGTLIGKFRLIKRTLIYIHRLNKNLNGIHHS